MMLNKTKAIETKGVRSGPHSIIMSHWSGLLSPFIQAADSPDLPKNPLGSLFKPVTLS
jgi:hypothetical protein